MRNIVKWFSRMFIPTKKNLWKPQIFRPKNLFKLAVVLLVFKFIAFTWLAYFPQTSNFAVVTGAELIELTNQERSAQGLEPLIVNARLVDAATKKAIDMINQGYFSHTSPKGLSPWYWFTKAGYKYSAAGENLARGFSESEYVHQAWMNSPTHKANILNGNYKDIGIAVIRGTINGKETTVAVELFGKTTTQQVAVLPTPVITPDANKTETPAVINVPVSKPIVQGEEIELLKGPEVFKQRSALYQPESWMNTVFVIVLGIVSLILMLSFFINIKIQYPKMILMVLIFIVLIAAIALFNGGALLNSKIDII
ncbi:MAG: CAP domain-containing protein [Patescibacteria group bacterium]